jgi:2-aminoethylphosphonate-pyruvate transaminase
MTRARSILLNPGPVTLSERVRSALTDGDWCHREPEFAELTRTINGGLVSVYPAMQSDFDAVTLTGSGTAAVEAMLATFAPDDARTLVLANGVYGERMARMLDAHRKPCEIARQAWTEAPDLDALVAALDRHTDVTHIAVVHHETTTGRLNDLDAIGAICRERGLRILLDGVSSFGAEAIDAAGWQVEAVAATANKCLHGVPGLSFVLARKAAWHAPQGTPGSVYLDLRAYHRGQHAEGYSPFTQAVQVAFALREALAELAEQGGWEARREAYRVRAARVHLELTGQGVSTLLSPADYSSVLWSYLLPPGVAYQQFHDALKERGFVIYAGQGELAPSVFRLAYMGDIQDADLDALCDALRTILKGLG